MRFNVLSVMITILVSSSLAFAASPVTTRAGKYTVELSSQPSPPTVGENLLVITVKDGEQPLSGAGVDVHIDMTTMPMPADVKATPGATDGEYGAVVNLSMAGAWKVEIAVQKMPGMPMDGDGTARFLVKTGKGITAKGGGVQIPWFTIFAAFVILAVILAIVLRKRLPHQTRGIVAGILTLLVVIVGTVAVVKKYRDTKTSTVIGAALMDMDTSAAAPGTVAVATETVQRAPFQSAAVYTGTVVPDKPLRRAVREHL